MALRMRVTSLIVLKMGRQRNLDSSVIEPSRTLGLFGEINHAAPAFTHLFQKLVAANDEADRVVGGFVGQVEFDGRSDALRLRGEKGTGFLVRGEQSLDALTQPHVVMTGGVEECGAL